MNDRVTVPCSVKQHDITNNLFPYEKKTGRGRGGLRDPGTGRHSQCHGASPGHSAPDRAVQGGLREAPGFRDKDGKEPGAVSDYKDCGVSC